MTYTGPERRRGHKVGKILLYGWIVAFTLFNIIVWHNQRVDLNKTNRVADQTNKVANINRVLVNSVAVLAVQGAQAKAGVCAYKADLTRRTTAAEAFLQTHPDGILDITAAELLTNIKNQKAALKALAATNCNAP